MKMKFKTRYYTDVIDLYYDISHSMKESRLTMQMNFDPVFAVCQRNMQMFLDMFDELPNEPETFYCVAEYESKLVVTRGEYGKIAECHFQMPQVYGPGAPAQVITFEQYKHVPQFIRLFKRLQKLKESRKYSKLNLEECQKLSTAIRTTFMTFLVFRIALEYKADEDAMRNE